MHDTVAPTQAAPALDALLIERCRQGDKSGCGALVERHQAAVYRFARHLLGDGAAAEDVLQETFITALQSLPGYRGDGSIRGWLLAIARSKVLRHRRRHSGEPASWEPLESLEALGLAAGFGTPMTPEALASLVERQALLQSALSQLGEEEREVVVLRDVEGLSGDETAAALGLSLQAMKSRLHRARLQLVAAVKQEVR